MIFIITTEANGGGGRRRFEDSYVILPSKMGCYYFEEELTILTVQPL